MFLSSYPSDRSSPVLLHDEENIPFKPIWSSTPVLHYQEILPAPGGYPSDGGDDGDSSDSSDDSWFDKKGSGFAGGADDKFNQQGGGGGGAEKSLQQRYTIKQLSAKFIKKYQTDLES